MRYLLAIVLLVGCGQGSTPVDSGVCDGATTNTYHCGPTLMCGTPNEFCFNHTTQAECRPVGCDCFFAADRCACLVPTVPACPDGGTPTCSNVGEAVFIDCL